MNGAGRTDRGAHATGQVASFPLPEGSDLEAIANGIAERNREEIEVRALALAPAGFHARTDASAKTYVYRLWRRELGGDDTPSNAWSVGGVHALGPMQDALRALVGTHDFRAFATPSGFERASTVRHLVRADLEEDGPLITVTLQADAFLYKMVRNVVRAAVRVGEGKRSADWIRDVLESQDRSGSPGAAPASGLTLERVHYPHPLFGDDGEG